MHAVRDRPPCSVLDTAGARRAHAHHAALTRGGRARARGSRDGRPASAGACAARARHEPADGERAGRTERGRRALPGGLAQAARHPFSVTKPDIIQFFAARPRRAPAPVAPCRGADPFSGHLMLCAYH